MLYSCSIHRGWLLLDSCLTASRSVEILLHALFFTCFASFFYLVIHSILFHHIHAFIWILCTLRSFLIIFIFLGWSFLASCTLCQSWQKMGEIVENMWFLFKILHVKGKNTCLFKGELCFILLGGVFTSFLYTGLVTIFTYIVLIFDIYMMMHVFFTYLYMCCFFFLSLYTCFFIVCNLLFLFHTKMPWWVLFKVFQKYRLLKSSCHKLSSCKVFQEFVLE